jgi:thiamine pyrophosphate-dependent acetolactate synthase large subunit-like protein
MPVEAGKHALLQQLVADGVRYIFGNPGTTEQAFMDALPRYPQLEFILCLHESVAVAMADLYARATRRPAFVLLHIAPGLGNAAGMLFNANASHTSLVVLVGQSSSDVLFQEPLLSGDLVAMAEPLTKWAYQITHASDVPQAVRRAFKIADEAPQGPVVLSLPLDVADAQAEVHIQPTSFTRWRTHPDPAAIADAADLLAASHRPLLLVGDGVALSDAQEQVGQLAELLGAPIYEGYSSDVNTPAEHPLVRGILPRRSASAPDFTNHILAQHDVLLAIGTPLFRFIFPRPQSVIPAGMKVIQIDVDGWEIGKSIPGVLGIKADCRAALEQLMHKLKGRSPAGAAKRVETISAEARAKRAQALADDRKSWDNTPISVARMMGELVAVLPPDTVICDEAITSGAILERYVKPRPGHYFRARGGGIGPGLPGTLGVKLAFPDKPVVGVIADGSAMFTITALWTAAHHRIPVTWVICNNASYRILKENLVDYLGPRAAGHTFVAMDLTEPPLRFDRIAESLGVFGRRVERPEELRPALVEALALGGPAVVDVAIDGRVA